MSLVLSHGRTVLSLPTSAAAVYAAPVLYSDAERDRTVIWHEILSRLCLLREHDHLDDSAASRAGHAEAIGGAVAAVLMAIAINTKDCSGPVTANRWQHRAPDATLADLRAAFDRLSVNAGKLARHAKDIRLAATVSQQSAASHACLSLCRECLDNGEERSDLLTVAAFHKLSLRECLEAFAATRSGKINKNRNRYGKEASNG